MIEYEQLPIITKNEAEKKIKVADRDELCRLLLSICRLEDSKWIQNVYLKYISDEDKWVASAAITGLGHLARISGELEKDKVISALEDILKNKPELEGKINDTINDINVFLGDK